MSQPIDVAFRQRPPGATLTRWLYDEIRAAILDGRLTRGALIPPTRHIAAQHSLSRRIVVNVFDQLRDEGYLSARTGSGTRVSDNIPEDFLAPKATPPATPRNPSKAAFTQRTVRPFLPVQPTLSEFPIDAWLRLESRSLRSASTADLSAADPAGNHGLRSAIAAYLGVSRGVACSADEIIITSGTQQSLDLLARVIIRPRDPVWVEDPGYRDAAELFRLAGARIVPVPVDADGMRPSTTRRAVPRAIYVTPAHQFPLGASLRLDRRLELLRYTRDNNIVLIEDDYDSEFRFSGRPIPAMKGLGAADHVVLLGTFSKALFPALRIGYIAAPHHWIDPLLRLRRLTERFPASLPQRTLAAFLNEGHFARHLRRVRELYASRLAALRAAVHSQLAGVIALPEIEAGLHIPAFLDNSIDATTIAERARAHQLDLWTLQSFALTRTDLNGFLLGFAAFTERQLRESITKLARLLTPPSTRPRAPTASP
jgi:GntR family transcriptional regulator/MocR family aminotransferase